MYTPALLIVPPAVPSWTDHVTAWFVLFVTVAANDTAPPTVTAAVDGVTETATDGGGGAGAVAVRVDVELAVGSATLVALTW